MYLRRHCYDKAHKCPGRNGGGFKYPVDPKGTPEPDWYRELCKEDPVREPWEQSNLVQQHWWQQLYRCDRGMIYMPHNDPWRIWRWGHCNRCDVLAIPMVSRYLDPKWVYYEIKHSCQFGSWRDLVDHKSRWVIDETHSAPWWSLPDTAWRIVRWKWFRVTEWLRDLYTWYRHPSKRHEDMEWWYEAGKDR